jgi:hypothetical protein
VAEEQVTVMASHIPAPARGSSAKIASPAASMRSRPGAEVQMSNQASVRSNAAPAAAGQAGPRTTALEQHGGGQRRGRLRGVLVSRYVRDFRKHGKWARASRAAGWYTVGDLEALMDEYIALLHKYGHSAQDAPPGARLMQLRMFYIPDEPDEQHS